MKNIKVASFLVTTSALALFGCSSNSPAPAPVATPTPTPTPAPAASVIVSLNTQVTVGSTVDAANGDSNPYGLTIVPTIATPVAGSLINPGDLVVCNFNDKGGNSGAGTTIEVLTPVATGTATPRRVAQDPSLAGCNAIAINPGKGNIWVSAYTANDNPIFSPLGALATDLKANFNWNQPWGQIYASPTQAAGSTTPAPQAFYISQAGGATATTTGVGSIVQANITATGLVFNSIISGFPTQKNPTYGILAPAGLTYDPASDTLYVVSSDTASVLSFAKVSTIAANGVTINYTAPTSGSGGYGSTSTPASFTFSGPNASQAKVVFTGSPLNGPVSSALLYNGDLIVGNTGDNNLVEVSPSTSTVVGMKNIAPAPAAAGAIFGIATSGTTLATQKIYFNNDNTNSVVLLSQ